MGRRISAGMDFGRCRCTISWGRAAHVASRTRACAAEKEHWKKHTTQGACVFIACLLVRPKRGCVVYCALMSSCLSCGASALSGPHRRPDRTPCCSCAACGSAAAGAAHLPFPRPFGCPGGPPVSVRNFRCPGLFLHFFRCRLSARLPVRNGRAGMPQRA